jgi:hypothetical protein
MDPKHPNWNKRSSGFELTEYDLGIRNTVIDLGKMDGGSQSERTPRAELFARSW